MKISINLLVLFWICNTLQVTVAYKVIVKTCYGYISGSTLLDYNNEEYYAFQSVPYAKPPLGSLRFRPPEEAHSWHGIKDGTQESTRCVQPDPESGVYSGQEDCLFLNVYTKSLNQSSLQSVVVYLHGGGFFKLSGSLKLFNPKYLITENIVIVTINYRLGSLGFLTLNDTNLISPNNGFRDQIMALKWVQSNIKRFGGNPSSVTLSGESAGAMATHYHLFSPQSIGLFHKIICRSSTALMPLKPIVDNTAIVLAEQIGLNTQDIHEMVRQLRNISTKVIFKAQVEKRWFDFYLDRSMYNGLHIEKPSAQSFVSESLMTLAQTGNFNRVPMMLSITNMEGLIFNTTSMPNMKEMTNMSLHIPALFGHNSSLVERLAREYYYNISGLDHPLVEFWGDIWFKHPAYRTLTIATKYQKIYMAHIALDTKLNLFKLTHNTVSMFKGAAHTDDDYYIYFKNGTTPKLAPNSIEELWMKRMVRLQANFIKYSNPTPFREELLNWVKWTPYSTEKVNVLKLTNENLTMANGSNQNYEFWDRMYKTYATSFY